MNAATIPDLAGKVVLITGPSTGIGAAAAAEFGRNRARVIVHYNASADAAERVANAVRASGGEAISVQADVMQADAASHVIGAAVERFGRLDVLVNNAGGLVRRVPVQDYTDDFVDEVLALNVLQVTRFMREAVPHLRRAGGGVVINVSSIAARNGGGAGSVLYAAAKAFIATATRGWAKELVRDGIRVNAVSPGVIMTPFHERHSTAEQIAAMQATIPMNRVGTPDECVGAFLYLASNTMSGYVTGQNIEVNGGQYMP